MKKKTLKTFLLVALIIFTIIIASILIYIAITIAPVKNLDLSLDIDRQTTRIFDNNYEELDVSEKINQEYVSLDELPDYTKQAFLSIEDKDYYNHNGLNYKRIAKATLNNLKSGKLKEGASTITQQLVKNKYLTNEKTFNRKIKEAYLTLKLENKESKDKIFETYLNTIYFGNGAYGIGNASKIFFNKNVAELTLSESAILAGCIKSPSNYSPLNNKDNSLKRRNLVLKEMLDDEQISSEQYNNAINEDISIDDKYSNYNFSKFDLYTQYVLDEASKILNTNSNNVLYGGYKIYTYQDMSIQSILNEKIADQKYYEKNELGNIADSMSIIIDNNNYGVSAIAGKSKYDLVNFNRQPGSLIKPIMVYMPALEEGLINEKTQVLDEKIDYNGYSPNNVGNKFYGYISIEDCVAKSLNIPTIKVAEKVGLNKCIEYAKKCGIEFNEKYDTGYALALGGFTDGISLKDITDSYSVLTNNGNYEKSRFIKKIVDNKNMTIYEDNLSEKYVYNDDTAYLMTKILDYSVDNGTSKKLSNLPYDIAGKTGTVAVPHTNKNTDAYSLAYTTNHTMSVWLGNYSMNDDYHLLGSNNGGTYATQIINDTFTEMYKDNPPDNFVIPDSVQEITIDNKSLTEDHIVVSGDKIPERYQSTIMISKRYPLKNSSTKFAQIDPFDINIQSYKNSCEITYQTYDYIDYKLYRVHNDQIELLNVIKNHNGEYSYIDRNIIQGELYSYYVEAYSNYSDNKFVSNSKQVLLEKSYDELLSNNNDDFAWMFN